MLPTMPGMMAKLFGIEYTGAVLRFGVEIGQLCKDSRLWADRQVRAAQAESRENRLAEATSPETHMSSE
jgi:hypothetical protein